MQNYLLLLNPVTTRLPANEVGMIVDRGRDFPLNIQVKLQTYGAEMWIFRDDQERITTRAANIYRGDNRGLNHSSHFHIIVDPNYHPV